MDYIEFDPHGPVSKHYVRIHRRYVYIFMIRIILRPATNDINLTKVHHLFTIKTYLCFIDSSWYQGNVTICNKDCGTRLNNA